MRVQFVQSGGFAGTIRHCTLDTAQMSAEEARTLESLVRKADLAAPPGAPARAGASRAARDLEEYQLSVDGDTLSVVGDPSTLSPDTKALIAYLKKCARPGLPGAAKPAARKAQSASGRKKTVKKR